MIRLLAAALLVACGSARPPAPPHRVPDAPPAQAGSGSAAPVVSSDEHPTEPECDALFAHAIAIEMAERPADQQLAEPELATLRAQVRERELATCRELTRQTYTCMRAAAKTAELVTCK